MDCVPSCFGRWISESTNKCERCRVQLDCYSKMREIEKEQEGLNALGDIPWYKRSMSNPEEPNCKSCDRND